MKSKKYVPKEKFYDGTIDCPDHKYSQIREPYWEACNILRELISCRYATREQILSELEDDL